MNGSGASQGRLKQKKKYFEIPSFLPIESKFLHQIQW